MIYDLPKFAVALSLPSQTAFATDRSLSDHNGWSPKPTQHSVPHRELFRRQEARPHICGFWNGEQSLPITCPGTMVCGTDAAVGFGACCDPSSLEACPIGTLCKNENEFCEEGCRADPSVYKCGIGDDLTCGSILYDFGSTIITNLFCTDGDDKSAVAMADEDEDAGPSIFAVPAGPNIPPDESEPSDAEPEDDESANDGSDDDGVSAGVVAGSIVGGLAVIASLIFAIFCVLRRDRRRRNDHDASSRAIQGRHPKGKHANAELPSDNSNVAYGMNVDLHEASGTHFAPIRYKVVEAP